ncbi:TIR domain-containing protein [Mesorhizobium sp. NPDC059054]|uniref:TIR domain-containing protein n=1 Tax=Mesorhizobium sp. NPDC059054 TaxID=3346711 RepID=UPI0036D19526
MVRAFLSHSSKDKYFVSQVAKQLGDISVEYDERTFEHVLNNQAIRNALQRSEVFALFVSKNSISSSFVSEEERTALESRARGQIKQCIIFAIDDTSYRALPEWLRELNIVTRISGVKACARRIQALLTATDALLTDVNELYIGRDEDDRALRKALSAPQKNAPIFIHAVGYPGIGRKTFLRKNLQKLYPRIFSVIVDVTLPQFSGLDELYRGLYSLNNVGSISETIENFVRFSKLNENERVDEIAYIINEMNENGEFICITDEGAVYNDEGDYQPFFKLILSKLSDIKRPGLSIVQTRMMPALIRQSNERSFHIYLRPLADEAVQEWLGLELKERDVNFTASDLSVLSGWLDGHPYNIKFAIKYIEAYGLPSIVRDPSELIEWKRERAEDFLARIEFSEQQAHIMAALLEYRYLATEMIFELFESAPSSVEVARDLRRLEEFCCIDRRQDFFHISAPLREAIRRDDRFHRTDKWKQKLGETICNALLNYKDEDAASVEILESATIAAVKGAKAPSFLARLILPSHLLRIARDFYDRRNWKTCAEFCERAWESRTQLPSDAVIELLRLWGLSSVRMGKQEKFSSILSELSGFNSKLSRRVRYFLKGFSHRLRGELDKAEEEFLGAYSISPDNDSVNRELASLYCKQRRYIEAEKHARAAYERYPTNPFLIDVYVESLLGKLYQGLKVDHRVLEKVLTDLRRYGDAPGSSFFLIRDAQQKAKNRDIGGALRSIASAIDRTPELLAPYFIRADIFISVSDIAGAERDLAEINRLLNAAGGFSREDEAQSQELEIRILMEKSQFEVAKDKIDRSAFLPAKVKRRLYTQLSRGIAFNPQSAGTKLQAWAKKYKE